MQYLLSFIDLSSQSIKQGCLAVKRQVTKSKRYYTGPKHLTLHNKHYDASQDFVCSGSDCSVENLPGTKPFVFYLRFLTTFLLCYFSFLKFFYSFFSAL